MAQKGVSREKVSGPNGASADSYRWLRTQRPWARIGAKRISGKKVLALLQEHKLAEGDRMHGFISSVVVFSLFSLPVPIHADESQGPAFVIDHDSGRVMRCDPKGQIQWSTRLDGYLGLVRPPHLQWDERQVYVSHEDGVTALDARSGTVLWHSKGPSDRLLLDGDLLFAADCSVSPKGGRWLLARGVAKGEHAFKIKLPTNDFDVEPIQEVAGLLLVQKGPNGAGKGDALLIDRIGQIRHRLNRQVIGGQCYGEDKLFHTCTDIVRVSRDDKVRWSLTFGRSQLIPFGGFVDLADGDVVAFRYSVIADSGVDLLRFTPATGKSVWEVHCRGLGKVHSKYTHDVTVAIDEGKIRVTTNDRIDTCVETLDLKSGRQLNRTVSFR